METSERKHEGRHREETSSGEHRDHGNARDSLRETKDEDEGEYKETNDGVELEEDEDDEA